MTLDPQLRLALPHMRAAGEANWYVLTAYILHANTRGRAWPSIDTLCRETGYARPAVVAARAWLVEQGALHKVNYALRVGEERGHPRAEVMQVTGVIHVGGREFRTLTAGDELPAGGGEASAPPMLNRQPRLPIDGGTSAGATVNRQPRLPEESAAPAAASQGSAEDGGGRAASAPGPAYRPIFGVWEQESGQRLTPLLADILAELCETYGEPIVVEAVREAVRTAGPGNFPLKYVMRIMERWVTGEPAGGAGKESRRKEPRGKPGSRRGRKGGNGGRKKWPKNGQVIDFRAGR